MNYDDHAYILKTLKSDQHAEEDLREEVDEVINFLNHPQGQWEDNVWSEFSGRPRYTFDQCNPAVGKVWAEMAANEYSASVQPVGDGADEETSNVIDGLFRNIYNLSSFEDISTKAGKRMISAGFAAWRVVSKFADPKSFYQDLMVIPVNNAHRRVWFDANAEMQTKEDAGHVFVLSNKPHHEAKEIAGRDVESIDDNRTNSSYQYKPEDTIVLGEILYKKRTKKTIYLIGDAESSVLDEDQLEENGLTPDSELILDSRETEEVRIFSRKFDGRDWMGDEKETAFSMLPIIPEYANFDVNEDGKTTFKGMIRPVMDHQRVFNYAESRKVEESVLAARKKLMVDNRVADGYEAEFGNMNRDPRAAQLFNGKAADNAKLPFFETTGPAPNPAVSEIADNMIRNMQLTLGLPNEIENINSTNKDSDFRFQTRTSMGQVGTFEYYRSHKVALEHTAKVLLAAIPRVYDTERKVRIVDEGNQSSEVTINGIDQATGAKTNSLTSGRYDVVVNMGKDFESRQADANTAILELGSVNPEVVMRNTDIIASNIKAPGMRTVADRERVVAMKNGYIPEEQWTDDEKEKAEIAKQQQGQQPDPNALIAQAQVEVAQAETAKVQTQLLIEQAKLEQRQLENQGKAMKEGFELEMKQKQQEIDELKTLIDGAKTIAETEQINAQSQELLKQQQLINQQQAEI